MDYQKIYNKIIENRKQNPLPKDEYGEKHHIIPKCLGGDDKKDNLVKLTAREHFLCHYCLVKIYEGKSEYHKMLHAFIIMKAGSVEKEFYHKNNGHKGQRYLNSCLYESLRIEFSKNQSNLQTGKKNSQFGKIWIVNYKLKENKKINKEELDFYLFKGWQKGSCFNFEKYFEKIIEKKKKDDLKKENEKLLKEKYKEYYEIYEKCSFTDFIKITGLKIDRWTLKNRFEKYLEIRLDSEKRKKKMREIYWN